MKRTHASAAVPVAESLSSTFSSCSVSNPVQCLGTNDKLRGSVRTVCETGAVFLTTISQLLQSVQYSNLCSYTIQCLVACWNGGLSTASKLNH